MRIDCNKCGQCCKGTMGPFVFPSDIGRICRILNKTEENFIKEYCVKQTLVVNHDIFEIYTIRQKRDGSCFFLNEYNLCAIYEDRPYQCKNAPYNFLSGYGLWDHMKCIDKQLESNAQTIEKDMCILSEIIDKGYKFERRDE